MMRRLLLLCAFLAATPRKLVVQGFAPLPRMSRPSPHSQRRSRMHPFLQARTDRPYTRQCDHAPTTTLLTPREDPWENSGENASGDDDSDKNDKKQNQGRDRIDLGDQDWRSFRARLVMAEQRKSANPKATSSATPTESVLEDDDLDGIGALFADTKAAVVHENETTTTTAQTKLKASLLDSSESSSSSTSTQWAYDSGNVIEQGAVILGGVEQHFGFGLRQQYFHKAAILVLDHGASFTKGIILNRPTDYVLLDDDDDDIIDVEDDDDDDDNNDIASSRHQWKVWFGGDVQGMTSSRPEIVCLHSLQHEMAVKASVTVMKDIQWTSFEVAKQLVRAGVATPRDFWVFAGYAGWGPEQLMGELDRKSWYMVATDSQTLLQELARLSQGVDPREAGLDTWELLMNMIGRGETADEYTGGFDDLMLKEWARQHLLGVDDGARDQNNAANDRKRRRTSTRSSTGGGEYEFVSLNSMTRPVPAENKRQLGTVNRLLQRAAAAVLGGGGSSQNGSSKVRPGMLLRAADTKRSPFLLDGQELHKSVLLVLTDDDHLTIAIILNRMAQEQATTLVKEKGSGSSVQTRDDGKVPIRFGGIFRVKGNQRSLWLHRSKKLRDAGIGSPVGSDDDEDEQGPGICKCSDDDTIKAIERFGLACIKEFILISGVSVWTKEQGDAGLQAEVDQGRFEFVSPRQYNDVWKCLRDQETLTRLNLMESLRQSEAVWQATRDPSSSADDGSKRSNKKTAAAVGVPIGGLGDGFDEEDDNVVFGSDVKLSQLSDDALQNWVATFLLDAPALGNR